MTEVGSETQVVAGNRFFEDQITCVEGKRMVMVKNNITDAKHIAINSAHAATQKPVASILRQGRNLG